MQPGKMARSAKRAGPKTQAPASGARRTLQPPPSPPLMKGNLGVAKALAKGPPGGALMHGMGLQTQWRGRVDCQAIFWQLHSQETTTKEEKSVLKAKHSSYPWRYQRAQ